MPSTHCKITPCQFKSWLVARASGNIALECTTRGTQQRCTQRHFSIVPAFQIRDAALINLVNAVEGTRNLPCDCASGVCIAQEIHATHNSLHERMRVIHTMECNGQSVSSIGAKVA